MNSVIGFIPAAGMGSRMCGFPVMKELLPIPYSFIDKKSEGVIVLIEDAFNTILDAGADCIVVAVNEDKTDLIKIINNNYGFKNAAHIAFVFQQQNTTAYGVPYAINCAQKFLRGKTVIMRFPDTILVADQCLKFLLSFHEEKKSELTLGVFPTEHPERLGPVIYDSSGRVLRVEDKPRNPSAQNTWNCLIWEDSFTQKVIDTIQHRTNHPGEVSELIIADIIREFITEGHEVYAHEFENSACYDISCVLDFENVWETKKVRK